MAEQRKDILRPQWDSRKQMWKIVKKTYNGSGGWARFGGGFYFSKDEAERKIEMIVGDNPNLYGKEQETFGLNIYTNERR